eukprot:gene10414-10572_t
MAWLGAQLKAQLKAAENLLEAVDRTVSTATGVLGTPPQGTDSGSYTLKQHGPFSPSPLKQPLQLNPEVQHPAQPPATATGGLASAVAVAPLNDSIDVPPGAAMEISKTSADEAPAAEVASNAGGNSIDQPTSTASSSSSSLPDGTINTQQCISSSGPASNADSLKEAQLTKLVDTLRKRLDTVRAENQQLEDLLHSAEHRTAAEVQRTQQLEAELAAMQRDQDGLVASAAANAAAQDVKIGRMQQELEAANRQVAALQGALETIQEQHQQMLSSKDTIEGGALEAVHAELAAAESQLAAERRAHSSTKAAATARERHLEEQLSSSSEALAAMQRQVEDMAGRTREVEEQQLLALAEAARLREQVQQLSVEQESAQQSDPSHQLQLEAKCEALQLRLDEAASQLLAAHQAQRAAEAHVITVLKQDLGRVHAEAAAAQTSSSGRVAHDIIPMDALGEPYQRLARHNKLGGAVQATARFLDTTAATAGQLLRQQPLARLIMFVYVVLIHLYVYFLLARMQRHALQLMAAQEKAPGLGPH